MKKWQLIEKFLVKFIYEEITKTGLKKGICGLSGGIDSAVVAVLAKKALEKNLYDVIDFNIKSQSASSDDWSIIYEEVLDEAKELDSDLEIGDFIEYDLEFENMGRYIQDIYQKYKNKIIPEQALINYLDPRVRGIGTLGSGDETKLFTQIFS